MYPRTNYEMTEDDLQAIMDACKPVPMIALHLGMPRSAQERANDAWAALGKKMGFDHMTVQPVNGKGNRLFTAIPSETETSREERLAKEKEAVRDAEIERLNQEIEERQKRLNELRA